MATIKKLNPDNATANAKVKSRPAKNRRAGASSASYRGVAITSTSEKEAKRRIKEAALFGIPLSAIGGGAMYSLIKNTKK
jgi:hypothetical protein